MSHVCLMYVSCMSHVSNFMSPKVYECLDSLKFFIKERLVHRSHSKRKESDQFSPSGLPQAGKISAII